MKYAFMSFSTPSLTLEEMLRTAREYGYDGVEPRLDSQHVHGIEVSASAAARRQMRQTFEKSGIALCCLATSLRFADPSQTRDMLQQAEERIILAGDLGAPCLRVFGGVIPAGIRRDQAIQTVVEALKAMADTAEKNNVLICMETHDDWCDPEQVAKVMESVDHPAVAVNWDIMHPVRLGFAGIEESFQVLKPWIRHLHVHDGVTIGEKLQMRPIGQGDIDHKAALSCLQQIEYNGFISGEWINWQPYETHLPRELAVLKKYEQELA